MNENDSNATVCISTITVTSLATPSVDEAKICMTNQRGCLKQQKNIQTNVFEIMTKREIPEEVKSRSGHTITNPKKYDIYKEVINASPFFLLEGETSYNFACDKYSNYSDLADDFRKMLWRTHMSDGYKQFLDESCHHVG
jgi:hypothetical protein